MEKSGPIHQRDEKSSTLTQSDDGSLKKAINDLKMPSIAPATSLQP